MKPVCTIGEVLAVTGALLVHSPANAQNIDERTHTVLDERTRNILETQSVLQRLRPEFDPVPLRAGGFDLLADTRVATTYDDNVRATDTDKIADGSVSVKPSLSLRSRWSRHRIELNADATAIRYFSHSSENSTLFTTSARGKLEIDALTDFSAALDYDRSMESRGSSGDQFPTGGPVEFAHTGATATFTKTLSLVQVELSGTLDSYRYRDHDLNGIRISLADRNYRVINARARVAYGWGPGISVFATGGYNTASYPNDPGPNFRGSKGFDALGGIAFGVGRLVQGEASVGYIRQTFDDPVYPGISGLNYAVSLVWSPTRRVSLTARGKRTIGRSPLLGVAATDGRNASFDLTAEVRHDLIFSSTVSYDTSIYRGAGRSDYLVSVQGRLQWLISRRFVADVGYTRQHGRPGDSGIGRRFDQNVFSLGLVARF